MTIIDIKAITFITVEADESLTKALADYLESKFDVTCSYKFSMGSYDIKVVEETTAKYYPSRDWYEDDEYDFDSLTENDFEDAIASFREEYEVDEDIEIWVNDTEWERN